MAHLLVFTVGPALSANTFGSVSYTLMSTLLAALSLFPTSVILTLQSNKIEHQRQVLQETEQCALAYQRAVRKVDNVLNHILKNNVINVKTCIEQNFNEKPQIVPEHAPDLLLRSMW